MPHLHRCVDKLPPASRGGNPSSFRVSDGIADHRSPYAQETNRFGASSERRCDADRRDRIDDLELGVWLCNESRDSLRARNHRLSRLRAYERSDSVTGATARVSHVTRNVTEASRMRHRCRPVDVGKVGERDCYSTAQTTKGLHLEIRSAGCRETRVSWIIQSSSFGLPTGISGRTFRGQHAASTFFLKSISIPPSILTDLFKPRIAKEGLVYVGRESKRG